MLDLLRKPFDAAGGAIREALDVVVVLPTSAAQFMANASPGQLIAWQCLTPAVATLNQIAAIAAQFGPRGMFPMFRDPNERDPALEFGWCHDFAIMCCAGDLRRSSYAFHQPSPNVKSSPWLRGTPHLNPIAEAAERVRSWVETDWDAREAMRPDSGYLDANNVLVKDVRVNPHSLAKR